MDASKIKIFIGAIMNYGRLGYLDFDNQELCTFYEECLVLARNFHDTSTSVQLYLPLGILKEEMKSFAEALSYYKEFLNIADELGDNSKKLEAYNRVGNTYMNLRRYDEALSCHENFLRIAKDLGLKRKELSAYIKLEMSHFYLRQYQESVYYCEKGLEIAKDLGDREKEGNAYGRLGNAHMKLRNYLEALKYYKMYLKFAIEAGNKSVEKTIYWNLGCTYKKLSKYQEAITNLENFLAMAIEKGDKKGMVMAYGNLANPYEKLGKYEKLIEISENMLKLAKESRDKHGQGVAYLHLGVAYHTLGKRQEETKCLEESLKLAQEIGDKQIERNAHTNLGNASRVSGQSENAIMHHKESMRLSREMSDRDGVSDSYLNLGVIHIGSGRYEEAMECYQEGLNISKDTGNQHGEGTAYINMGCVSSASGKYYEANGYFEKALNIFRIVGYKKREVHVSRILGNFYANLGMYERALEYHEKSFDIALEIDDIKGQENALGNIGSANQKLEKFSEALQSHEKCLKIAENLDDKIVQARTYANMGSVFQLQGEYDKAFKYYEKSLAMAKDQDDMNAQAQVYANLGGLCILVEEFDEAIQNCTKSLGIASSTGDKKMLAKVYNNLGSAYHHLSNDKNNDVKACQKARHQAINYLEEALRCWEWVYGHLEDNEEFKISIVETYVISYKILTKVLIENGQPEKALVVCDRGRARALGDLLFTKYNMNSGDTLKNGVLLEHTNIQEILAGESSSILSFAFNEGIVAWILTKDNALQFAECDNKLLITETKFSPNGKYNDVDLQNILIQVLDSANKKIMEVKDSKGYEDRSLESRDGSDHVTNSSVCNADRHSLLVSSTENKITSGNDKNTAIVSLQDTNQSNHAIGSGFSSERVTTNGDQHNAASDNQEDTTLFDRDHTTSPKGSNVTRQSIVLSSVDERAVTRGGHEKSSNDGTQHRDPLGLLYKILITPIVQNLKQDIVIIPDGHLYKVPFAALRDPNTGTFLSETKSIRLAPSLSMLKTLKNCPDHVHSKTQAFVVAVPEVKNVMFKGKKEDFPFLTGAVKEVKTIGSFLGATSLIGSQATKNEVKQKLREGVALIHIAAHGEPENGNIVLSPPTQTETQSLPKEQDYMLTMHEVQEIGVSAKLVVLSCCFSGLGEIKSEGMVGMSRAFLAAGARAVVASLWAISDEATLSFMTSFYTYLMAGESASKSLKEAMDEVRFEYKEPKYWAPFFLIGDDVTVSL